MAVENPKYLVALVNDVVDARGWTDVMGHIASAYPDVAEDIRNREMQALVDASDDNRGSGRREQSAH